MIGLLALGILMQSVASAPETVARPGGWMVVDEVGTCLAITRYPGDVTVSVSYDFGLDVAKLMIANPAWESVEAGRDYPVVLEFSNGRRYPVTQARGIRAGGVNERLAGLSLSLSGSAFLDDFAASAGAALFVDNVLLEALSLLGTRAMVTRLRRCAAASHRRYSPDPFARVPSRPIVAPQRDEVGGPRPPQRTRANLSSYFSIDDYPAAALRENGMGTVGFDLTIGPDGRITDCLVTASSGSAALDQATCRILRARARYTPARDANGNPTQGQDSGRVTWRVPAD